MMGPVNNNLSYFQYAILAVVGMLVLHRVCRPFDTFRKLLWAAMGVGLLGCFLLIGKWFDLFITEPAAYLVLAALAIAALGVFAAMQALFKWIDRLLRR